MFEPESENLQLKPELTNLKTVEHLEKGILKIHGWCHHTH